MPCVLACHSDGESNSLIGNKIPNIRNRNSCKRQ